MKTLGLIFLGPPGAGKGTQASIIAEKFSIPHISTGEILRNAIASGSELGKKARDYVDRGELVPDELILDLIRDRLCQSDAQKGWILDGFPRNLPQAHFLADLLGEINQACQCVLNLEVRDDLLVERLLQRGRKDDNEETIRRRLGVYHEQTTPLIGYYQEQGTLYTVDGSPDLEVVTQALAQVISSKSNFNTEVEI
ncbi:adenylate kinase [Gloeocapsa sp. PCC 73106]|uniref:adenylate kinase n=1 Tax=Gloeocapsa sp. PCC 73106 TaxID=102232 RepID=UPI0002AC737E|nr:adenylate kinase [Gloeocapsa sp. PCC 73106]ELR98817.1 adenylate kinase-like kinase [Gloeocapsa sp. PCC 73106]